MSRNTAEMSVSLDAQKVKLYVLGDHPSLSLMLDVALA